jgi:hypothetical protein
VIFFDDFHHNVIELLESHAAFGIQRRNALPVLGTKFELETKDDYQFYERRTFV